MFELTVITGPDKGQVFRSNADEATIGREAGIEMTLTDHSTSRKHARIFKRGRFYEIEDLKSGNGTILNAERITRPAQLHTGDLISLGKDTIRFHQKEDSVPLAEQTDYLMTATITMRDLQRELAAQRGEFPGWDPAARAQQDMAAIFRSGQALTGLQTGDELHPRIIEVVLAELPRADRCSLILSEAEGQEPSVQITQARKNSIGIADTMYKTSLAHTALAQQQAMLIRDPGNDTRIAEADTVINKNIRSAIFVPIQTLGGVRGVLYADCVTENAGFDEPDLKLLSVISLQAAAAIDNIRLFEKLHEEKTALATANASIKLAQQRLVQSEKLAGIGELAAGIVHDIRNPIQLILGHAQYLQSTLRDTEPAALDKTELTESLMEIERGVGHVNSVVTQLLAFARQSKPELRTTRLNDVALDTMRFLQPETNKNRVKVLTHLDPLMPPVLADPSQLKQVIVNIVINAVQAMPNGGNLTVTTALLKEQNRDMVSLALADTGAGMTPDQLEKIFDPFFTTKPGGNGGSSMGLGLSVSYGIIENHGGRILVDSEPARGTCFTILLPAHNVPVTIQPDDPRATFHG